MSRFATRFLVSILTIAATVATFAPNALAGTRVSGTLSGSEVMPEAAEFLRANGAWKQRARYDHMVAQRQGNHGLARQIEAAWRQNAQNEARARRDLNQARTRVTVYGDAGGRVERRTMVRFLRAGGLWRKVNHLHIWQVRGALKWGTRAPRGYDDRRGSPARPTAPVVKSQPGVVGPYGVRSRPRPRSTFVPVPTVRMPPSGGGTRIFGI